MDLGRVGAVRVRSRAPFGLSRSDALTLGGLAIIAVLVAGTAAPSLTSAANPESLTPSGKLNLAAEQMRSALAAGFNFTVVARSTLNAKAGGPKIEIPDPSDPYKVAGVADTFDMGASAAVGTVRGDEFFLQMYGGAIPAAGRLDTSGLEPTLAALVTGGKQWRNDGAGWYQTDQLPGIGLDPRTAALLPSLLGRAARATDVQPVTVGDKSLAAVAGEASVDDAPGLMAIDAASFTELTQPVTFVFDAEGRLAELTATMRNTRVKEFDLIVVATITFDYSQVSAIPSPEATR